MNIFQEIENLKSRGFWADEVRIDRLIVESHTCPKCHKSLTYRGLSNAENYHVFGVCQPCGFGKSFWTETAKFTSFKKRIENLAAANAAR